MSAIRPDNPAVDSQRPGFCVVSPETDLFLCDDATSSHGMTMGRGWKFGYCRASGNPRVWQSLAVALDTAARVGGRVTTVPRRVGWANGGPVLTWDAVPA